MKKETIVLLIITVGVVFFVGYLRGKDTGRLEAQLESQAAKLATIESRLDTLEKDGRWLRQISKLMAWIRGKFTC